MEISEGQKEWDEILHGTNPAIIWGTKRLEWKDILDQGVFAPKFNALFDLLSQREQASGLKRNKAVR